MIFTLDSADHAYSVLVETMNEGTATLGCDGTILYCNRHFAELLRMPIQAVIGTSIYRFIVPDNVIMFKALMQYEKGKGEINLRAEDGIFLPVYLSINSFKVRGSPNVWCLVVTDLTEQKKNEKRLANIEIARKKEIHHRIKNNLQVISSLLDLQAEKFNNRECIQDSEVLTAFRESQDRVISISLIHEELYKGEEIDTLDFSSYIEELSRSLFLTYRLGNADISLNMDLEENIFFDMDTAVSLGMIVNELVSNSLKHAFPGRDEGKIRIKLRREENRERVNGRDESKNEGYKSTKFILIVSDNGIGISENLDIEDLDSLGFQLVTSLVDQLDGEFELKMKNGTEFVMKSRVTEKN
ncbi:MAG: histidine kinase dimerization/phosphoacceptor domain -containing protein [Methanosarcina sp.]